MSAKDRIFKLEALLGRIKTRSAEPHISRHVASAASLAPSPSHDVAIEIDVEPDFASVPPSPPETVSAAASGINVTDLRSEDANLGQPTMESHPRLAVPEPVDEELETEIAGEQVDALLEGQPLEEEEEAIPSSSRRPIAVEQQLSALAREEEAAPVHTPPPESGRQVAAAPAVTLEQETTSAPAFAPPELVPEKIHVEPPVNREIANYATKLREFKPASFGELIQATLKL